MPRASAKEMATLLELKRRADKEDRRVKAGLKPTGYRIHIVDMHYTQTGLFRHWRLLYGFKCEVCQRHFHHYYKDKVKCPTCGYEAEMWVLIRDYQDKEAK